ncbi:MAG: hypothetical protein OSB10_08250 [Planctomycetota bacterium]|nr:hypothetical protein [Planctomycetota bacterium]
MSLLGSGDQLFLERVDKEIYSTKLDLEVAACDMRKLCDGATDLRQLVD